MGFAFNPFTGNFDAKGSGGGGASYIDGEVQNFSALPETLGSPAVDSAYLVREPEGTWLLGRKPAGIYIRTANTGVRASDWTYAGEFPDVFNDANFVLYDDADSTKNAKFQLSSITTGQTRTLTVPNASGTIQLTGHASAHAAAGSDPVTLDASQIGSGTFNNARINFAAPDSIGSTTPNTLAGTQLALHDGTDTGTFVAASKLTANRTYDLPDASGTLALTGQLTDTKVYTANDTWTKPAGAKLVHYLLIGGGGGGGAGRRSLQGNSLGGGGGGAGGGITTGYVDPVFLGSTESITVGAGGAGAANSADNTNGATGTAGGDSSFGSSIKAKGGTAGGGGSSSGGSAGAATTLASIFYGTNASTAAGAAGAASSTPPSNAAASVYLPTGGGGGGARASSINGVGSKGGDIGQTNTGLTSAPAVAAGTNGPTGIRSQSSWAGTGGGGGSMSSDNAVHTGFSGGNGGLYGGGGGGGSGAVNAAGGSTAGGTGGAGIVVITTYF